MFKKIEHIGIAVTSLATAIPLYEKLLGTPCYKQEVVDSQKVATAFFKVGDSKIELLQATDAHSVIAKFIEKKGEGFHHIAYAVQNIQAEIKKLQAQGFVFLNDQPVAGADNMLVAFIHPKSTDGVLTELCMPKPI